MTAPPFPGLFDDVTRFVLSSAITRVAEKYQLSRQRVSIAFDAWPEQDGGDSFDIILTVPPQDGRQRHENVIRGSGNTLAEAEASLARRWDAHVAIEAEDAAKRKRK